MSGSKGILEGLNLNKNINVNDDDTRNISRNNNVNKNVDADSRSSAFVIPKKQVDNSQELHRASFYLKKEHIKNINKHHKQAGMGKSEFLNYILDKVFEELKIK